MDVARKSRYVSTCYRSCPTTYVISDYSPPSDPLLYAILAAGIQFFVFKSGSNMYVVNARVGNQSDALSIMCRPAAPFDESNRQRNRGWTMAF